MRLFEDREVGKKARRVRLGQRPVPDRQQAAAFLLPALALGAFRGDEQERAGSPVTSTAAMLHGMMRPPT